MKHSFTNTIRIVIGACLLSSSIILALVYLGFLRFNYADFSEYPVQGPDVSRHQGSIGWDTLRRSGYTFAFIKATEGGDWVDPRFHENWRNAQKAGLAVGAYHFFTFRKSGAEQARNFINTVPADGKSLPPVIDLEYMGNSRDPLSKSRFRAELSEFISIIEKKYHRKPILYSTYEFYGHYLEGHYDDHPLWIRDIFFRPRLKHNRKWTFWQYANRGRVDGIKTYVDLNAFNGGMDEFMKLIDRRQASGR